jgi:hypothetical protein
MSGLHLQDHWAAGIASHTNLKPQAIDVDNRCSMTG